MVKLSSGDIREIKRRCLSLSPTSASSILLPLPPLSHTCYLRLLPFLFKPNMNKGIKATAGPELTTQPKPLPLMGGRRRRRPLLAAEKSETSVRRWENGSHRAPAVITWRRWWQRSHCRLLWDGNYQETRHCRHRLPTNEFCIRSYLATGSLMALIFITFSRGL